ncbi:hypothetical protein M413DRAFT_445209 [Hebeloma cylindrosporum]|uniref:MYND-type domain-containing protein n=1 Tax=Hebeloma cylindrosporum TaxID=76867 RepID=A0A0C3CEG1_HEBCY|nr:hypothetical protein M413DRAFT_445209 [Hebeloma cylindrosporum h7]
MNAFAEENPPILSKIGQACYQCFMGKNEINPKNRVTALQRCTGCLRVSYCGSACQKANWSKHKKTCQALKSLGRDNSEGLLSAFFSLDDASVIGNADLLHRRISNVAQYEKLAMELDLGGALRMDEQNLIGWEPRCLACGRSDLILRLEAAQKNESPPFPTLQACPDCELSFYCSERHCELAKDIHKNVPSQDGLSGLSQCATNNLCFEDARMARFMDGAEQGPFIWAPERVKPTWSSLRNLNWNDFMGDMKRELPMPDPAIVQLLRAGSDALSMPMTILWGLENLNSDDGWTRKDTLNIHVLGAAGVEIQAAKIFEEILHRVPLVKNLKLTLCGPELGRITASRFPLTMPMDTCPDCARKRRTRTHILYDLPYHEVVSKQGGKFVKPDLAIAFNSGCSQEDVSSWEATLRVLAQRKIPTVFTAYNQEESVAEANIMRAAGMTLHPELGPGRNPWGSILLKSEPNEVTGFYSVNGWLSGGFN